MQSKIFLCSVSYIFLMPKPDLFNFLFRQHFIFRESKTNLFDYPKFSSYPCRGWFLRGPNGACILVYTDGCMYSCFLFWFTELHHQLSRNAISENFNLMSLKRCIKEISRNLHSDFANDYVHYTYLHIPNHAME